MKIVVGADDEAAVVDTVVDELRARGHDVTVLERAEWPDVAKRVAESVASGAAEQGVLFCWTGTGTSMAANKVPGVRAAMCYDEASARNSREHNGANMLTLGGKVISNEKMRDIVRVWLATDLTEERHRRRVAKIDALL